MGVISSTLRIVDGGSSIIAKNISIMTKMIDTMERMNRAGDMPGLDDAFNELRTEVSLASHELEEFQRNMHEAGDAGQQAATKVSGGFGGISKAIVVANQGIQLLRQGYQSLQSFMGGADERTGADARLAIIRDELRTQEQLEAQVMAVANATRTSYETTAELVAKMGRQDYFRGQNDKALAFAQTLNQGLIVSGAGAAEANSAILQLSQGIASGVLRGEEFNSIMENGSVLAEMMATSLGVTKGQLRAMAQEGMLTADVVVSSIMQQSGAIEEQFRSMPVTFGQSQTQMSNMWSQILNDMSQAGRPIDTVVQKMQELVAWMNTIEGQRFLAGMAAGIGFVLDGITILGQKIADVYTYMSGNWTNVEPMLWGIGTAVAGLTVAYGVLKGTIFMLTIAEKLHQANQAVTVKTMLAATAAQWKLNTAMLANPMLWVVGITAVFIAALIAAGVYLYKLYQSNIDFRVKVIEQWNNLLGFFDQVPVFFQWVSNGVLDGLSHMKVGSAMILQGMVNDAISNINRLIELANKIPGVSVEAIGAVDFGTQTAIAEEIKRQERAANLQTSRDSAATKAAEREAQLARDAARWRLEAAEKEAALAAEQEKKDQFADSPFLTNPDFGPVELGGGTVDKVGQIGKEVDISNQSLAYLRDIAELQALENVNAYSTVAYEVMGEARLSDSDADLLKSGSNFNTNVYYLNYTGGVRISADVKNGENWDSIRRQMEDEIDNEIESGLSDLDRVVNG